MRFFEKRLFPEKEKNQEIYDHCLELIHSFPIAQKIKIDLREERVRGGFDLPSFCTCVAKLKMYNGYDQRAGINDR